MDFEELLYFVFMKEQEEQIYKTEDGKQKDITEPSCPPTTPKEGR